MGTSLAGSSCLTPIRAPSPLGVFKNFQINCVLFHCNAKVATIAALGCDVVRGCSNLEQILDLGGDIGDFD